MATYCNLQCLYHDVFGDLRSHSRHALHVQMYVPVQWHNGFTDFCVSKLLLFCTICSQLCALWITMATWDVALMCSSSILFYSA